jgi:hypothetical protein
VFLRGHGTATSSHYGAVTHQSGALGVLQGDATRRIIGQVGLDYASFKGPSGAFTATFGPGVGIWTGTTTHNQYVAFDSSAVVPTAVENRPVNRAVVYLVRAR